MKIRECRDQGLTKSATAARCGVHRETVAKYWDGPAQSPKIPRYKDRKRNTDPFEQYITDRLAAYPELTAKRIYEELVQRGFTGSYRTVRRRLQHLRPKKQRLYAPVKTMPGEQAQVDWGELGRTVIDGRWYKVYVFAFTMSWSRLLYAEIVLSLSTASFLACLDRALRYVGGVPRTILFDNAKTVVAERVGTAVRFNEHLLQFALEAGFTPEACWTNDPESKGKVESSVKYIKSGFFYGRDWLDVDDLQTQLLRWCDEVANQRIHGTTRCVPAERHQQELAYLKEVPLELPLHIVEQRRVSKDRLISVDNNRYFVETATPKSTLTYHRYENRLEIPMGQAKPVVIPLVRGYREPEVPEHPRDKPPSNPLQAAFEDLAPSAKAYLQGLSRSRVGHLREQMEKIVKLGDIHAPEVLETAMARAVDHGFFGYGALTQIIAHQARTQRKAPTPQPRTSNGQPVPAVNVEQRSMDYYAKAGGLT